ncbi:MULTISPECIES: hypothetical protein [unclassified Rhodococcus (in: high G+C Gram-positive bacteria)]|uniref:hypothetical protein n=1 Tax=unclassified Rhodococcus (in: high G+C Gram-positive bacteria) TaxID=192944 RepID=UPI0006BB4FA0|nr:MULTISPECIES: hypothetical protein [unclassified Rhodococcus (in: high G+C Gram-positive bacteria)]QHE73777.1 hypothetical protein GFS60_07443 [Rhodococcus sp. WAY2]
MPVVLHHNEQSIVLGDSDLQGSDDVGVPGEPGHRPALLKKALTVLFIEVGAFPRGVDTSSYAAVASVADRCSNSTGQI